MHNIPMSKTWRVFFSYFVCFCDRHWLSVTKLWFMKYSFREDAVIPTHTHTLTCASSFWLKHIPFAEIWPYLLEICLAPVPAKCGKHLDIFSPSLLSPPVSLSAHAYSLKFLQTNAYEWCKQTPDSDWSRRELISCFLLRNIFHSTSSCTLPH